MYKITAHGKTMVGCNEDAWRTTSRIWFVNAQSSNKYGAAFTGSRQVSQHQFAPQSGMNEVGLTFSRLASYYPQNNTRAIDKKQITNEVSYLTDILHECATVDDVKNYVNQYNHSLFIDDVFIYIDSAGNYLVVEPYDLIEGNDPHYVLSNFCPSITTNQKARKLERYRKGVDFLNSRKVNTSLSFCTAVSDIMHVCRDRNGDGTLLTSIWDTKKGLINLFFYHSFDTTAQFNLVEELAKGDHIVNVSCLFPVNPEFERFSNYITPFNTPPLRVLLATIGGFLAFLSFVYTAIGFKNRKVFGSYKFLPVISVLNLLLTGYFFVLATNINIYYFDAPYEHYTSDFISTSSYIPFLLLLSITPIIVYITRLIKISRRKFGLKIFLAINCVVYMISILGFWYWGLFDVFN